MKQTVSKNNEFCKIKGKLLLLEGSLSSKKVDILNKFVSVQPAAG